MRGVVFILLIYRFSLVAFAQVNLIPNPSFELYTDCPYGYSLIDDDEFVFPWVSSWMRPTGGSSDYFNSCADVGTSVSTPDAGAGFQYPHSGNAYAGMYTFYTPQYREYIQAKLTAPLEAGKLYYAGFYVNAAVVNGFWGCGRTTDDIGLYISNTRIADLPSTDFLPVTPQVENIEGIFFSDTSIWYLVAGDYIATGGEEWITIGNFYNNATTDYQEISGPGGNCVYLFVDDAFLFEATILPIYLTAFTCELVTGISGNKVNLQWITASEINRSDFVIEKSADGRHFYSIGNLSPKGDPATGADYTFVDEDPLPGINYYRLRQIESNSDHAFSSIVAIENNEEQLVNAYAFGNSIHIDNKSGHDINVYIYNINSSLVEYRSLNSNQQLWQPDKNLSGLFLLVIRSSENDDLILSQKIIFN